MKPSPAGGGGRGGGRAGGPRCDAVDPHLAGDVLQLRLAEILEGEVEPSGGVLLHPRRDADAAGLGERFEASGDVDAVAEDVAVLDDDVTLVDADAELDAVGGRAARVARSEERRVGKECRL